MPWRAFLVANKELFMAISAVIAIASGLGLGALAPRLMPATHSDLAAYRDSLAHERLERLKYEADANADRKDVHDELGEVRREQIDGITLLSTIVMDPSSDDARDAQRKLRAMRRIVFTQGGR